MATLDDVKTWLGRTMVDADGDKIGTIEDIYLDRQSGEPEWAAVRTGLFGTKVTFVPISDAQPVEDDKIRVPFQKKQVKDAPRIEPDGELSEEEERQLYEHYGRSDYGAWQGDDHTTDLGLPDEDADAQRRFARSGDAPDASGGEGAEDAPAIVGVRLRRVVVVTVPPSSR